MRPGSIAADSTMAAMIRTELLRDDAVRVARRCPGAQLLVWDGMPHVFAGFDFLPEAREATDRRGGASHRIQVHPEIEFDDGARHHRRAGD